MMDFFRIIDRFTEYLLQRGFQFSEDGLPVFKETDFLSEIPQMIVPVNQRKNRRVQRKDKTLIAFFCGDKFIYRRLAKLLDEIDEYRLYLGVVGADITVTRDMELEWQRATILLNQLVMAIFVVNGIKTVLNTRIGRQETTDMFRYMPRGVLVASGFRGGTRRFSQSDFSYIAKLMTLLPSHVLIYGRCNKLVLKRIEQMGFDYTVFPDFRDLCREVA